MPITGVNMEYHPYHEGRIQTALEFIKTCRDEMGKRIVGQHSLIENLLMAIVAGGHVLLEGVPGLAKTLILKTLAQTMGVSFKRIQFTPDLLPADLIGTLIYRPQTAEFVARKGPIFANFILADEINRAPAKVQSALLESMGEGQVTIGDETYPLPSPFFVLATQNPIEHEGTYALPEAQLDRFMVKLLVDYPTPAEEMTVLTTVAAKNDHDVTVNQVFSGEIIFQLRRALEEVRVDDKIATYIVSIISASREKDRKVFPFARFLDYGASPRASIALYRLARVRALFQGRDFVLPEDVKAVAHPVLRHRVVLSYEAEAEDLTPDDVITIILGAVALP